MGAAPRPAAAGLLPVLFHSGYAAVSLPAVQPGGEARRAVTRALRHALAGGRSADRPLPARAWCAQLTPSRTSPLPVLTSMHRSRRGAQRSTLCQRAPPRAIAYIKKLIFLFSPFHICGP
jgi:hypothetical protein